MTDAAGGAAPIGPGIWASIYVRLNPALGTPETFVALAHTNVGGAATDAPPLPEPYVTKLEAGACKLVVRTGTVTDAPTRVNMGDLVFNGLSMQEGSANYTLQALGTSYHGIGVSYPPCNAGEAVIVSGGADPATAFSLETDCIDPLVLVGADPLLFEANRAAELTWIPPSVAGSARIFVRIDSIRYVSSAALILCDAPDTGSLTVDAALVTGLIEQGTTGFPRLYVTRRSSASVAAGSGEANLSIESTVRRELAIPGVISCNDDSDCPSGQVCGLPPNALKCVAAP